MEKMMITIELGRTALVALLLVSCFLAMSVQGRQEKGRQRATAEAGFEKRPDRRNLQRYRGDAYTYGRFPTDPGYQRYRRRGSKGRYASKKSSKTKTRRNSSGKSGSKGKKEGYRLDYKKGKSTAKDYGYYDDYYLADDAYPGVPLDDFYLPDDELYYTPLEYYTFVEEECVLDPDDPFATPYYPYLGYGDPRYPPYAEQPYYGPYGPPRYGPSYGPPSRPYPPHYYDGGYASASDSADWARNRQLRGNQEGKDRQADENKKVESRKLKTRRRDYYYGKGSGGKGSGGKGSSGKAARPNRYAYNDPYYYEPHTYLSGEPNYYELGFEGYDVPYGWEEVGDGTLRPKCPPGYIFLANVADRTTSPTASTVQTPVPVTPEPITPVPVTPEPVTPVPVTPEPVTPEPVTPEPVTPVPVTPEPVTPEPVTPEPITPAPDTQPPQPQTTAPTGGPDSTTAPTAAPIPSTNAPTPPTASTTAPTPVETSAETARVTVDGSFIEYGFFAGTEVPEMPDPAEVASLIQQTNAFFSQVFAAQYPEFSSFNAADFQVTVDPSNANYPIRIDFDAQVDFTEGTPPPTRDEVFTVMQNSDLNSYISDFVWNTEPVMESLFYDVQRVRYDAMIM